MSELPSALIEDANATEWAADQSPGFLLWHLENLWQREQRRVLEPFSITPVQFLLLSGLAKIGPPGTQVSQIELARHCRTDPMMTSQVVRALDRAGLLRRNRDKQDKRAFAVALTDQGREVQSSAETEVRHVEDEFFAALGGDVPAFTDALRLLSGERPRRRVPAGSRNT